MIIKQVIDKAHSKMFAK